MWGKFLLFVRSPCGASLAAAPGSHSSALSYPNFSSGAQTYPLTHLTIFSCHRSFSLLLPIFLCLPPNLHTPPSTVPPSSRVPHYSAAMTRCPLSTTLSAATCSGFAFRVLPSFLFATKSALLALLQFCSAGGFLVGQTRKLWEPCVHTRTSWSKGALCPSRRPLRTFTLSLRFADWSLLHLRQRRNNCDYCVAWTAWLRGYSRKTAATWCCQRYYPTAGSSPSKYSGSAAPARSSSACSSGPKL